MLLKLRRFLKQNCVPDLEKLDLGKPGHLVTDTFLISFANESGLASSVTDFILITEPWVNVMIFFKNSPKNWRRKCIAQLSNRNIVFKENRRKSVKNGKKLIL
jgi:hypothetical protein